MKPLPPSQSPAIPDITTQRLAAVRLATQPQHIQPSSPFASWMLFPQRLFLALTFFYAGVQKFTDPQFFHKGTPGYIGNQIIGFAHVSPLHNLLLKVVLPHAVLFGWTVALGEIAIGLGVLVGLLFRPAAFFGLVLSTTFLLTASWSAYPYFYGPDIVFMFCWFTMILTGPLPTGLPSIDGTLLKLFFARRFPLQQNVLFRLLCVLLLGANTLRLSDLVAQAEPRRSSSAQRQQDSRRSFLRVALVGGTTVGGVAALSVVLRVFNRPSAPKTTVASVSKTTPTAGANGTATPASSATAQAVPETGTVIAKVSAVPENSAVTFTIASSGDPGVLIHLANQQFVAYDATCTHNGCQVAYDPDSQHLICPCHGATFDPAQQAAVLQGPANTPLASVQLHVYESTGDITIVS